LKKIINTL